MFCTDRANLKHHIKNHVTRYVKVDQGAIDYLSETPNNSQHIAMDGFAIVTIDAGSDQVKLPKLRHRQNPMIAMSDRSVGM